MIHGQLIFIARVNENIWKVIQPIFQMHPERVFLVTDHRVLNGPLGRSLHLFARTAHSAHLLYSTLLCSLAPFMASLTQFAHSLVRQLIFVNIKILELWVLAGQTALRNKRRTSNPRIVHGQRYPMPCLEWSNEEVEWKQGSGPKGLMSCRTQGWISRRPEKAHLRVDLINWSTMIRSGVRAD